MRKLIALLALAAVSGCGSTPETFADVSSDIESARATGPNLTIVARQTIVAESLAMTQLAGLIEKVARGVQDGVPGPTEETEFVQLQLGYASTDRLGNEGKIDFGTIRLPMADLRAAKLSNLNGTDYLELVDQISPSVASDLAIQYCADMGNFRFNPVWCTKLAEAFGIADHE